MVSQYVSVSNTLVGLATRFLSEICSLVSVRRSLWREDRSIICSVITQWFELLKTRNHTLLSHLRIPQPGGLGSRIYIPQEQGYSLGNNQYNRAFIVNYLLYFVILRNKLYFPLFQIVVHQVSKNLRCNEFTFLAFCPLLASCQWDVA
jgi:hypothetical protein